MKNKKVSFLNEGIRRALNGTANRQANDLKVQTRFKKQMVRIWNHKAKLVKGE